MKLVLHPVAMKDLTPSSTVDSRAGCQPNRQEAWRWPRDTYVAVGQAVASHMIVMNIKPLLLISSIQDAECGAV